MSTGWAEWPLPKTAPAPEWHHLNLEGIDMVPCPKEITFLERTLAIDEKLVIVTGHEPSVVSRTAAEDLAAIIEDKSGVAVPVQAGGGLRADRHTILIGIPGECADLARLSAASGRDPLDLESQGYRIFPVTRDGRQHLVLAGYDPPGAYWAAMTLAELVKPTGICLVEVTDWPDFKWREAEVLDDVLGLYQRTGNRERALQVARERIRFAARFKGNIFRIQNVVRAEPVTDYFTDDRAELLGMIGEYAAARGMRLFLPLRAATGVIGRDEEEFPQMKEHVRERRYYYTWSDEEVIARACERITTMASIIGPHVYYFHPPDIPNIGWERRSALDRERWGDDRIVAETYLANRIHAALMQGDPGATMLYLYQPYNPTGYFTGDHRAMHHANLIRYERKLDPAIGITWREHSLETAQQLKAVQGKRLIDCYIENNSFHRNRLAGAVARTYKTYFFPGHEKDIIRSHIVLMGRFIHHLPDLGLQTEYAWNTHAPGHIYVHTDEALGSGRQSMVMEDGTPYEMWRYGPDMEGPVRDTLLPRICRLLFGAEVGDALALAYGGSGTIHIDRLGGTAASTPLERYHNSRRSAEGCARAAVALAELWGQPDRFNRSLFDTYAIYRRVFKYVLVYQHVDLINAHAKRLQHISETGEFADELEALRRNAREAITTARRELERDYERYDLASISFPAIYGQNIGDLAQVRQVVDRLENEVDFHLGNIDKFGAGGGGATLQPVVLGIPRATGPVTINGRLDQAEWDLGNPVVLDASYQVPWLVDVRPPDPFDHISYWFFQHDDDYLYLAALVYDDDYRFRRDSALHGNDSIEFWLNREQLVVSLDSSGEVQVESYAYGGTGVNPTEIEAAITKGTDLYPFHPGRPWWVAEVRIPLAHAGLEPGTGEGRFHFAFGANDADEGKPPLQVFFPDGYEHLRRPGASLEAFATAVLGVGDPVAVEVEVESFGLSNQVQEDGTFTYVELTPALEAVAVVPGVHLEVRVHTDEGVQRFTLDTPREIDRWVPSGPVRFNTGRYHHDLGELHVELVVQTPWAQEVVVLQEGVTRRPGTPFLERELIHPPPPRGRAGPDSAVLFHAAFENSSLEGWGTAGLTLAGSRRVSFVPGRSGDAVRIEPGGYLRYTHEDTLPPEGLRISFWFKPLFRPEHHTPRTLLRLFDRFDRNRVLLTNNARFSYAFSLRGETGGATLAFKITDMIADQWNHVEIGWDTRQERAWFILNGAKKIAEGPVDFTALSRQLWIGAGDEAGDRSAPGIYDEIRIERVAINSDE